MMFRQWVAGAILIAAVFSAAGNARAQRVHLLAVGDTADSAIGKSVEHDLDNMVAAFFILLREGQLDFQRLEGVEVSAEKILNAIEQIRIKPDETLVLYWAGHGAFDREGHYLQMPKGGNLYRTTLLGALKQKHARLIVLLTDCCNEYSDSTAGKPPVAPASPDPHRKTSPLFEELLLKQQGVVDANAASQGEIALGTKEGGLFSLSLAYMMPGRKLADGEEPGIDKAFGVLWRNSENRISWQTLLEESCSQVQELFQQINPDGLTGRDGKLYRKQTVTAWTLPEPVKTQPAVDRGSRFGVEAVDNNGEGVRVVRVWAGYPGTRVKATDSKDVFRLQSGDVILSINGQKIRNTKDYWNAVKSSTPTMEFTVRDVRNGQKRNLRAQLRY